MKIEYFDPVDRKMSKSSNSLDDALTWLQRGGEGDRMVVTSVWFYESDISPDDLTHRDVMELPFNLLKFIAEISRTQLMSVRFPNGIGFTKASGDRKLSILMTLES
jgi:hypothetical protein